MHLWWSMKLRSALSVQNDVSSFQKAHQDPMEIPCFEYASMDKAGALHDARVHRIENKCQGKCMK